MSLIDFLQDIAIILYLFGSKITSKIGLIGAILFCIYCILRLVMEIAQLPLFY